jgi:regulatory protein
MPRKRINFDEATETERQALLFERACDYLSRREHSEKEIKQKLKRKFKTVKSTELDGLLGKLKEIGFQSDERFTESFVRTSVFRRYGPGKIRFDLGRKGIDKEQSQKAMEEKEIDFKQLATEFAERKFRRIIEEYSELEYEDKQKVRQKMYRSLCSRGFAYEDVKEVVKNILP